MFRKIILHSLVGLCLLLYARIIFADFSISYAKTRLVDNVYILDAKLNYELTEITIDALQNGISLTLELNIVVERERWYLWDEKIATLKQRYQLKYYALRRHYVLKYLNSGAAEIFFSLNTALARIGKLENFPLLKKHQIKPDETYWVYLNIYLDIESLPVPLRPIAHLSSQWRLSSNWYLCPLKP
jgi:hypothetical protein